jgi:catechol 2,3-dioxygenase-like lactoylglutathione lyase family enzyme
MASSRVHGVRYQTRDVKRAVAFYTQHLGFGLKHQQGAAFANVSCGGTDVFLSGPESSGGPCPLPTASSRNQADGIASCWPWMTFRTSSRT